MDLPRDRCPPLTGLPVNKSRLFCPEEVGIGLVVPLSRSGLGLVGLVTRLLPTGLVTPGSRLMSGLMTSFLLLRSGLTVSLTSASSSSLSSPSRSLQALRVASSSSSSSTKRSFLPPFSSSF